MKLNLSRLARKTLAAYRKLCAVYDAKMHGTVQLQKLQVFMKLQVYK